MTHRLSVHFIFAFVSSHHWNLFHLQGIDRYLMSTWQISNVFHLNVLTIGWKSGDGGNVWRLLYASSLEAAYLVLCLSTSRKHQVGLEAEPKVNLSFSAVLVMEAFWAPRIEERAKILSLLNAKSRAMRDGGWVAYSAYLSSVYSGLCSLFFFFFSSSYVVLPAFILYSTGSLGLEKIVMWYSRAWVVTDIYIQ